MWKPDLPLALSMSTSRGALFVSGCLWHGWLIRYLIRPVIQPILLRILSSQPLAHPNHSHIQRITSSSASIVQVLAIASRAATSRPSSAAPALPAVVVARPSLAGWWWSHESEFDRDLLLEELVAIGALDGGPGFVEGGVFDEDVALPKCISTCAACISSLGTVQHTLT
jgi:hypothetical protein